MNTEDFVTYEQALALKKLGFDYKVTHYYETNSNIYNFHPAFEQGWYTCYDINVDILSKNFNEFKGHCSAPTLAQVQKWLRKEKKYHIAPLCIEENIWYYSVDELIQNVVVALNESEFTSYEEALSSGITECIKILDKNGY